MELQLDFFIKEKTEMDTLKEQLDHVRQSNEKVRKSIFVKHAELQKKYLELHERMQIIERNICNSNETKNKSH